MQNCNADVNVAKENICYLNSNSGNELKVKSQSILYIHINMITEPLIVYISSMISAPEKPIMVNNYSLGDKIIQGNYIIFKECKQILNIILKKHLHSPTRLSSLCAKTSLLVISWQHRLLAGPDFVFIPF